MPTNSITLHKDSLVRLSHAAQQHPCRIIAISPQIPCATELGLPSCGEIGRWVPDGMEAASNKNVLRLTETNLADRCHYYADQYHSPQDICRLTTVETEAVIALPLLEDKAIFVNVTAVG